MRVLIAEDDTASRILLEAFLVRWGYEVVAARDGSAAWEILQSDNAPPIAILDWMMPKLSGIEVCQLARERIRELAPYILMLTTKDSRTDIIAGLDAGANDYLTKPYDLTELAARLRVARRTITLQRELADSGKAMAYRTLHDLPTGALNRGAILSALGELLTDGNRLSVSLISIHDYKTLQQRNGYACAEAIVRGVVQQLRSKSASASIGRYGSDQVLLIAPGLGGTALANLAEDVRLSVARSGFAESLGAEAPVRLSAGVVEWDGVATLELLLCYADIALCAAREAIELFTLGEQQ